MFAAVMHLSRWRRVSAAVLALWFGGLPAESLALRSCPMHDRAEGAPAATARDTDATHATHVAHASPASPASHGPHASHGAHSAHLTHAAPTGDGEQSLPSPCNCLGQCLGAGFVAFAAPRIAVALAREARVARLAVPVQLAAFREAPRRLPFAIPPPVALSAA